MRYRAMARLLRPCVIAAVLAAGGPWHHPAVRAQDPAVAVDVEDGQRLYLYKMLDFTDAGILTTASDLLFSGGREGDFYALDARTGALLWRFAVGGPVQSGPMTYAIGGHQFVAVNAGSSLYAFALRP